MRALWLQELALQDFYLIKEDGFHHLVNVVRLEKDDELLLLNGKGLQVKTVAEAISKRELTLKYVSHETQDLPYHFDLALGMPKREALELSLKEATELGFRRIFLIKSDYSQMKAPEPERIGKLLVSALEQSNAPYLPEIRFTGWKDITWEDYDEAMMLDSQTKSLGGKALSASGKKILIVGPEGGFSSQEISFLHAVHNLRAVKLPTPILRTPTAVAAGAGMMIENLLS